MASRSLPRRKAKPSPSVPRAATADPAAAATPPDLEDQLFNIACRAALYAAAVKNLDLDEEALMVEKEAAASLSIGLSEIHADLMKIVERLAGSRLETNS
jgi:hypothetical protein